MRECAAYYDDLDNLFFLFPVRCSMLAFSGNFDILIGPCLDHFPARYATPLDVSSLYFILFISVRRTTSWRR